MDKTVTHTVTRTGQGQVRKTRKSAQREADLWNASGSGARYFSVGRTNVTPPVGPHFLTIVAAAEPVEGGYACVYTTTFDYVVGQTVEPVVHTTLEGRLHGYSCPSCGATQPGRGYRDAEDARERADAHGMVCYDLEWGQRPIVRPAPQPAAQG